MKEISDGDFFGLEELNNIAWLKLEGKDKQIGKVKRLLKVTTTSTSKLLYLTAQTFYKMFGELELNKLKKFEETVNMEEIKKRVM